MPGGRLRGENSGDNMRANQRRNNERMTGSWIPQGGPDSAMPEYLAASAVAQLPVAVMGVIAGWPNLSC